MDVADALRKLGEKLRKKETMYDLLEPESARKVRKAVELGILSEEDVKRIVRSKIKREIKLRKRSSRLATLESIVAGLEASLRDAMSLDLGMGAGGRKRRRREEELVPF